jgi:serine/threonine-protein kinase RsbW
VIEADGGSTETPATGPVPPFPLRDHEIELRMSANRAPVAVLRALAADAALREDFDLDAVADLRLAVSEVCETVLAHATPDATFVCRLLGCDHRVEFDAATDTAAFEPNTPELSWHLLRVLTDTASYWTTGSGDRRRLHLRITKAQPAAQR